MAAQLTIDQLRERIATARKSLGLSQQAASEAAGITQGAWSRWENGGLDLPYATLAAMGRAVGIDLSGPYFQARKIPEKITG